MEHIKEELHATVVAFIRSNAFEPDTILVNYDDWKELLNYQRLYLHHMIDLDNVRFMMCNVYHCPAFDRSKKDPVVLASTEALKKFDQNRLCTVTELSGDGKIKAIQVQTFDVSC